MPLSDIAIRTAKPGTKARKLFDERGLYLEIAPAGGKWWRLKYRVAGREKRLSFGVYPDVSLKDARERRDEARKLLAAGVDPSENRKAVRAAGAERAGSSFEVVSREWMSKQSGNWVAAHLSRIKRLFERDLFPALGKRAIADITSPDLRVVIDRIGDRALETAHRALATSGQVFRYAIATGRCTYDPSAGLKGSLAAVRGSHFAATTDPKLLGAILRAMDAYDGTPAVRCALRLAPLVFVRPGELRRAEWKDIDFTEAQWSFRVTKTKVDHIVPLSRQALGILRELQPHTGNGRFIFPSARSNSRPMSDNAVLAAMRRMDIQKEKMSGHGFRAVARTILDEVLQIRVDYIEHQLAHAVKDPNGRAYNRTMHLAERRKMMQTWADYLETLKVRPELLTFPQSA